MNPLNKNSSEPEIGELASQLATSYIYNLILCPSHSLVPPPQSHPITSSAHPTDAVRLAFCDLNLQINMMF